MKLALQTGAAIYPSYVFGATDMLDQLAPLDPPAAEEESAKVESKGGVLGFLGKKLEAVSRKMGGGLTVFYGRYGLPIPYKVRMSMVIG